MATTREIQAEKRKRRLRTLLVLLAAAAAYSAFRLYQRSSWEKALAGSLPARLLERSQRHRAYLGRTCPAVRALPGLSEILAEAKAPGALAQRLGALSQEFSGAASVPKAAFTARLLDAPTYYVTEYEDPESAFGAWAFLRHMPDVRGPVLLAFLAGGRREEGAEQGARAAPAREILETYDRAIFFDSFAGAGENACPPGAAAQAAGRLGAAILFQIEAESGGPARFAAIRAAGQEAGLWTAIIVPQDGQIELLGPAPDEKTQDRMALLLLMGPARQIVIEKAALAPAALGRLQDALGQLGKLENLEVR